MPPHATLPTAEPAPPRAGRLVDQRQAAVLASCSRDTIIRARRAGRLPHSRFYGQRWLIAVDDLAIAGLLRPAGAHDDAAPAKETETDTETADTGPVSSAAAVELARAEARVAALQDLLARQDDELAFLRQLATEHLRRVS